MEADGKDLRNQNGQMPTDKPTKKLITPRKKNGSVIDRKSNLNTTGKDYKQGVRHTTR